jgi:hypothetical protein
MQMMADIMQMPIRIHKSETNLRSRVQPCLPLQQQACMIKWKMQMAAMGLGFETEIYTGCIQS